MSLLESIHGVAIHPNADDVSAELAADKITLGRPGGLTLSSANAASERAPTVAKAMFDVDDWKKNREGIFNTRLDALIEAEAALEADQRTPARINLARFYMARGFYPEAKAVLDMVLADAKPGADDPVALIVHSVASTLMGRPGLGLKDLANPVSRQQLRFAIVEGARLCPAGQMGGGAREVQERRIRHHLAADRPAAHRHHGGDARRRSRSRIIPAPTSAASDLGVIGIPPELKPSIAVMRGRLAEALGHDKDALAEYKSRSTRPTGWRRLKPSCTRSRCCNGATRSPRPTRCANWKRCR